MPSAPTLLMVDPAHYDVSYAINPWMAPGTWARDADAHRRAAVCAWRTLEGALGAAGAEVVTAPGAPGLPDMVFPANAAVVLDGRALLARFRHPERRGEEPRFAAAFEDLRERGLLDEVAALPEGCYQEGAGDCVWDASRGRFWAGFGPRSKPEAAGAISEFFGAPVTPLELVSDRSYHLDVCLCPLSGGEVLYYPPAFSPRALAALRDTVPADQLIEATAADADAFCVNAVNLGRTIVMATPPARLRAVLEERGYRVAAVDLAPFILSGGAAFCMTLRLDQRRA
ncbi:amidinotransferase [Gemmatimonadetes bacterium T265]|nr:amidinotransferase [Gemmatimonadetes bacterium T265]